jgi:hypothetical protein
LTDQFHGFCDRLVSLIDLLSELLVGLAESLIVLFHITKLLQFLF